MANALDAAALAIASELSSSPMSDKEINQSLEAWFAANLNDMGYADVAIENLQHTVDPETGTISVSSSVGVPTKFIHIGGIGPDTITVGVDTQVSYSKFDVELALVLDVTGSMSRDPNDMEALKKAATSLVDTLIPDRPHHQNSKIKISIVPYSQGVNLGEYATRVTNGNAGSKHCATERSGDKKYTDAIYNYDGNDSEFFGGETDYEMEMYSRPRKTYSTYAACPSTSLLPLTAKRTLLLKEIDELEGKNGTAGQTGISWGWYTLSPTWASLWPPESSPADYDDEDTLKFAVIMTDGGFNMQYDSEEVTSTTGCHNIFRKCETTTTKTWYQTWYPYPDYNDEPAARGREFCDAMKKEGIRIYSIFFETVDSNFGKKLMSYCASESSNFYYASSQSDLISAFGNIAKKVQAVYLAK